MRRAAVVVLGVEPEVAGDLAHVVVLLGHHEADPDAVAAGARRAPDPVDVGVAVARGVEVDHVGDVVDVDPAGRDVGGDERVDVTGRELSEGAVALVLGLVAVHRHRLDALLDQALDQAVGAVLGADEDQRAAALGIAQLGDQSLDLGRVLEVDEAVRDLALVGLDRLVDVAARLVRVGAGDLARRGLEGGGEEQRLAVVGRLGDDPVDGGLEAHVEHPVGLVDDQDPQLIEGEGPAIEQVLEPARGGDDDVGAGGLLGLLLEPDAAVDRGDRERPGGGDVVQIVDDLQGELAGRGEDQRRGTAVVGLDALDQRDPEGEGLARAGGRLDEDVVAVEDILERRASELRTAR